MKSPDLSPRSKIVATATALALSISALAGCGDEPEVPRSCYAMPYGDYSDEVSRLIEQNDSKYDNVTNRIVAAMVTYLGFGEKSVTKKFDGWASTSLTTRRTIANKYDEQGLSISGSDLPRSTDYIAFELLPNSAKGISEGGKILAFPDGTMAFKNLTQLNSYTNNTGGFNEISCLDLTPVKTYPE